ncbi:MAG: MFS transporter [Roseicyclus sp.]|uniref:MFS transporter n=1 Tax=Boseongicola sp. H5 TaxID=2763261 RepID=UPI001B03FF57|nr:MFS transporter [Boseongicola sp. H5]MBO6602040.1 MFS transporter [Roseicyclus sp.]MBO6623525.1 MFS transporter [Roseicyclus sp.]MBO6923810.1 MFS transporter [Roseicyclus sp.]
MAVLSALRLSRRAALGFVAMGVLWGSFAAQVPVLKAQIGADDAVFGLLLLGSPLGLLATLWLAPLFDRRLGALSLPIAALAVALAYLVPGLATGPWVFLAAMVGLGLGSGLLDIVSNARVSELEARHNRSLMNANHGMFSVAYAVSAIATGFAREAGLSSAEIFSALALLVAGLSLGMRSEVTPVSDEERRAVRLPWAIVLICGGIVLLAFFVEAVVESWSALHIERTLGGRAAEGAFGPAILGLTMALGRFSGQAISGRFSDVSIITLGAAMACAGAFLAALAGGPFLAYIGFGIMGLGVSVVGPMALALVGRLVPPAHRTSAVARVNVMGFAAFLLAPLVMGQVSEAYGLRVAFAVVGGLALIAPILALMLRARSARYAQSP